MTQLCYHCLHLLLSLSLILPQPRWPPSSSSSSTWGSGLTIPFTWKVVFPLTTWNLASTVTFAQLLEVVNPDHIISSFPLLCLPPGEDLLVYYVVSLLVCLSPVKQKLRARKAFSLWHPAVAPPALHSQPSTNMELDIYFWTNEQTGSLCKPSQSHSDRKWLSQV